jgi:hypothetical protein
MPSLEVCKIRVIRGLTVVLCNLAKGDGAATKTQGGAVAARGRLRWLEIRRQLICEDGGGLGEDGSGDNSFVMTAVAWGRTDPVAAHL